jgi:hypothetical protein
MRIHLFENVVDLVKKIAPGQSALAEAPRLAANFGGPDIMRLEEFPYFRREPVDELSTELNRSMANGVAFREHAPADPVARLEDHDGKAGTS